MHGSAESIRVLFRSRGLRCTRQREAVYAALAASRSHPTADELLSGVGGDDPELSLATVYNTLDALCECGLARRVPSESGGPCRFDADTSHHAHVVMPDGAVVDVPEDLSRAILSGVPADPLSELCRRLGVKVDRVSVRIHARPSPSP
ncbi:MAG: transcriptional repressor [Phycisphaeraceae bacterium]|nr:MAG: transcriptional repressor [Phycisphaeraceae bacterium]